MVAVGRALVVREHLVHYLAHRYDSVFYNSHIHVRVARRSTPTNDVNLVNRVADFVVSESTR
jgi:hypothetical protein